MMVFVSIIFVIEVILVTTVFFTDYECVSEGISNPDMSVKISIAVAVLMTPVKTFFCKNNINKYYLFYQETKIKTFLETQLRLGVVRMEA